MTASVPMARAFPRRVDVPVRALTIVVATALAYHYSLTSLARGLSLQTPLGYLALVPLIAMALAWVEWRTHPVAQPRELPLDFVLGRALGAGLLATAAAIALLVPINVQFWLFRVDLLSMPIFVAGATILLFGVRRAWQFKVPILFLLLAWPIPYIAFLGDAMRWFTGVAVTALTWLSTVLPLAAPVGPEGLFRVDHAGASFLLSVGEACAGVSGLVGFLLIGGSLSMAVTGRWSRRALWLLGGLLVVWILNIARIELIFLVGALFGESAAYEVLHPVAGLVIFNVGVIGMLLLVPRAGLAFKRIGAASFPRPAMSPRRRIAPLLVLIPSVLLLGVLNSGFARYEDIAGGLGQPRLQSFDRSESHVEGWSSALLAEYPQGRQYFGRDSTWNRLLYQSSPNARLTSSVPVYVDIIQTADPNTLAAYGIEECYKFHGYVIESQVEVALGGEVRGEIIDYHNPKLNTDWSALWWEWPYLTATGDVRYERIVVILENGPDASLAGATSSSSPESGRFEDTNRFLFDLGRELAGRQLASVASS